MFWNKHKAKEYDLHVERRETIMASYELTLHGISEKPFKIMFKANRENKDVLDTLNRFIEIVDRKPYEMREKLYCKYIKLLRPEIKLAKQASAKYKGDL